MEDNLQLGSGQEELVWFSHQLKEGRGLTVVATVLEGDLRDRLDDYRLTKSNLRAIVKENHVKAFTEVVVSYDRMSGVSYLMQSAGLGGLRPNSVMVKWPDKWKISGKQWTHFVGVSLHAALLNQALLVIKGDYPGGQKVEKVHGTIDIWWIVHDGGLLILLPFLLKQHKVWQKCKLRLFTVAELKDNSIQLLKDLEQFVYQLRVPCDVKVVEMPREDMSAYTYERTLMMEQRQALLRQLQVTRRDSMGIAQNIVDKAYKSKMSRRKGLPRQTNADSNDSSDQPTSLSDLTPSAVRTARRKAQKDTTTSSPSPSALSFTDIMFEFPDEEALRDTIHKGSHKLSHVSQPTAGNVRRMSTAVKLNRLITESSSEAQLVVVNLPEMPRSSKSAQLNYMEFVEALTEGLDRVLLVRGSGSEVITVYS